MPRRNAVHRIARLGAAAAAALALAAPPVLAAGDPHAPIIGVWRTGDNSEVTISVCPEDYCGVLTRVATSPAEYAALSPAEK
jgi:hypothetical protein